MKSTRLATIAIAAIAIAWPTQSFALAALAAGAATSCKITATNPIQRQIQVNCDPFAVTDFGITMFYRADLLEVVSVFGLNGYSVGDTSTVPSEGLRGIRVFGNFPNPNPPLEEVDVYGIIFQLTPTAPLDTILEFQVASSGDFLNAVDPATGEIRRYSGIFDPDTNPDGLRPSFDVGTVASGSIIPEPASISLLALPAVAMLRRRNA